MLVKAETGNLRARIDWIFVGSVLSLVLIGTIAILSAAAPLPNYTQIIKKHFIAMGMGLTLFLFALWFNYQIFQDQSYAVYGLILAMLVGVLVFGDLQRGQKAWFRLPFFSFQPSELARIFTVLVLANFLDKRGNKADKLWTILGAFAVVGPVMALIMMQPDFSSTLTFFPLLLGMLFVSGASLIQLGAMAGYVLLTLAMPLLWTLLDLRPLPALAFMSRVRDFNVSFLLMVAAIFVAAYLLWKLLSAMRFQVPGPIFLVGSAIVIGALCSGVVVDHQLKNYQRKRFAAFLVPEADPKGAAYNVKQAQIAIGSGGLWGKGIFAGTQSQLGFLPERHTDFIYAVIGEEMGFLGALGVLVLYTLLIWRIIYAARLSRDRYGRLVCAGLAAVFGFYLLLNVGMCLGLMPVAGVQLPLVSYGGSNLAITLFGMGIVANIYARRYAFY